MAMNKKELAVMIISNPFWEEGSYSISELNKNYLSINFDGNWYDQVADWCKKALGLDEINFLLAMHWWWNKDWDAKRYTYQMAEQDLESLRRWESDNPLVHKLTANELVEKHYELSRVWFKALPY